MSEYDWPGRTMATYKQHLKMNCGATAALFAVYGLRERLPDEAVSMLIRERLAALSICEFINSANRAMRATAVFYNMRVKLANREMTKIEFLEKIADPTEGIDDIIETNRLRCLILTCDTSLGVHWQTFFKPAANGKIIVYNERSGWRPMLTPLLSAPTAAIMVTGHRII